MFAYPKFDRNGVKTLVKSDGKGKEVLMDITVHRLVKGKKRTFAPEGKELAVLLTEGEVELVAGGNVYRAERKNVFEALPSCLHVPAGVKVTVTALSDCEFIAQSTANDGVFPVKFYRPEDIICTVSCEGRWENTAVRDVNTVFDYDNAPYSNMVLGEVIARQGRWWSYVPHSHPQPEVYYYKMPREEGFGACFIGDEAHTVKDGSVGAFPGGKTHVQVTAPGYPMYCCWMIRHLDGNPWLKTRTVDARYEWLEK